MSKKLLSIEEHRDLTQKEIVLMEWLMKESGHSELMNQIEKTKVISKCSCGCPTIDLKVDGIHETPLSLHLSAVGCSPEGIQIEVLLHVRKGLLFMLEAYPWHGTYTFSLPEIKDLKISEL